jgi:hypothetical protein
LSTHNRTQFPTLNWEIFVILIVETKVKVGPKAPFPFPFYFLIQL